MNENADRAPLLPQLDSGPRPQYTDEANKDKSWQDLAKQASEERDPRKLMTLVKDLCSALDDEAKPPVNSQNANGDSQDRKPQGRAGSR